MTQTPDNGGPAFPQYAGKPTPGGGVHYDMSGGMSLRDYIAIHASEEDFSRFVDWVMPDDGGFEVPTNREQARYMFADAMLAARKVQT